METGEQLQHRASGADTTSLSIGSLHPDYTYTYSVAAVTAIGMGPFSAFRSTRLPEDGKAYGVIWVFHNMQLGLSTLYQKSEFTENQKSC